MLEEHRVVLAEKILPPDVQDLGDRCKELIRISRDSMSTKYGQWEENDNTCKNRRFDDQQDSKAKSRKEPRKMVVPLTSSQVDTYASFAYMLLTQRENFYELFGHGMEDVEGARIGESLLQRDLEHSRFKGKILFQVLQNAAKYNLGVIKYDWTEELFEEEQEVQDIVADPFSGMESPVVTTELVTKAGFVGNRLMNISPYSFFPDPRFPLSRFQEGEFCGSEDFYTKNRLLTMQRDGLVAGVEHVTSTIDESLRNRKTPFQKLASRRIDGNQYLEDSFIITEVILELIPSETMFNGKPLGESDRPSKYVLVYANDDRLIRIDEYGYSHENFGYRVFQYAPDDEEYIGQALPELVERIQDAVNWFINSRINSVRKVIDNKLIVDPRGIDLKALKNRDPILLLKPEVQGGDVNRFVKQLEVTDVTTNHLTDVSALTALAEKTTGLNDNLLGQYASGRRSATESRNVNANAVARVKKTIDIMWDAGFKPLGEDMLANHRAFLDYPQMIKVIGSLNVMIDPYIQYGMANFKEVTKEDLLGNYDFGSYDATLPSQREQNAQGLTELLGNLANFKEILFVPQEQGGLGYNPEMLHDIIIEIARNRGLKNANQYRTKSSKLGQLGTGAAQSLGAPSPEMAGQPGNEVSLEGIM